MQFYSVHVSKVEKITKDAVCIGFAIPHDLVNEFTYKQGQYITLKTSINGVDVRRSYSLCSSPLDNEWCVGIKKVDGGVFSTYANEVLQQNDLIEVSPPNGKFYTNLHEVNQKKYIAFATGSGITPILSIIKTTLLIEPNSSFTLVYGNKNRGSIMFKETLEGLKNKFVDRFQLIYVLSREHNDIDLHFGRIDTAKCTQLFNTILDVKNIDEAFICGPEEMIFEVKDFLTNHGIDAKKIHFELFGTSKTKMHATHIAAAKNIGKICKLSIVKDGSTTFIDLPFDTENILDIALKNNIDLPFACKGGVCCTCKARLTKGNVAMDVNYGLEQEEIKAGFVLTCQSYPVTEEVTINFDDV